MPFPTLADQIQQLRRKSYTRYEIDRDLLRLGYDPADIDAAWDAINFPEQPVRLIYSLRFWLVFVEYLTGLIFLYFLLNFWFPGTRVGFLIVLGLLVVSSISAMFIEKWDKMVSRGLLYGTVVLGCGMYAGLFIGFYNMVSAITSCRGSCYP